jgi:hypothetical protein
VCESCCPIDSTSTRRREGGGGRSAKRVESAPLLAERGYVLPFLMIEPSTIPLGVQFNVLVLRLHRQRGEDQKAEKLVDSVVVLSRQACTEKSVVETFRVTRVMVAPHPMPMAA